MKSITELAKINSLLNQRKIDIEKEYKEIESEIRKNNRILWDNCEHEWVDQQDSSMSEKSTYRCNKCNLINDYRLYTIRR